MIYLNPPYQVVDGYTVLPDHADPSLFYVLPPAPRLGSTTDGRPAFSLVQYLGGGAGAQRLEGGLLTLTTELVIPEDVLPKLRERTTRVGEGSGAVQLVPALFDEGAVELVALGATSAPTSGESESGSVGPGGSASTGSTSSAAAPAGPFELRFLGSGKPSLGGANVATFQLVLDAPAAELIERSIEAPDLPIIAIYRMAFAGLRPSFQIDVQADWRKVYRSLQNKANVNFYVVAADAESLVSDALEENNITIDTTVFGTGEGARSAAERARKQLVDWVLEHLFTPSVDPKAATANAIGTAIEQTVWSLARAVLPGVGYRLRHVDEEQLRLLSARMNEAVAERREVIPQGTIGGILHRYRVDEQGRTKTEWPTIRNGLVQKINLDGFPRLEVKVGVEDRFASDGVSEVRVEMARPLPENRLTDQQTLAFRSAAERKDYLVNLLGEVPANFSQPYQYRVEVQFNPSGPFGPHAPVASEWQVGRTTELFVEPRWAYTIHEVEVGVAPTFSFTQFPTVTVELRYNAEGAASLQTGRVRLTEDKPSAVWRFRGFAASAKPYEYRVTYHRAAADGGDIEGSWQQQIDNWLAVPDPLPTKRTLNLFVGLPWPEITVAFVQLRYRDEANDIRYDEQIDLNAETRFLRRDYPIAANGPRTIAYRLTLLLNDGRLLEGSWRETEDERLVLDRRLVERRVVNVRIIGGTLAENRLAEVRIQLQVRDPATGQVREETELRLTSDQADQPIAPWEYLLGDPPVRTVHFSALFVDRNGFTERTPWMSTKSDLLVVQVRNKTVTA